MQAVTAAYREKRESGAIESDPDQAAAIAALERLSHDLMQAAPKKGFALFRKAPPAPKGVYLHGGVGRGKSMAMDLFYAHAPLEKKRRVHFHAFMLEVHDFLHEYRNARRKEDRDRIDSALMACAAKVAQDTRLLCFDEFQVKDVADAMILGRLFTALFTQGVAVVMTSNIAPDDLYLDGLQRDRFLPFIALLRERMEIIHFSGARDYRLNRLRDLKTYFWPADDDARRELENIFRTIADGAEGAPRDLQVKGRVVHVPRASKEVAWFGFGELCEKPRSAVDYLALAKEFRVFVIEDVPKMDDRQRNAVLRFVTFIDTAYDHHAQVVISAAAPPEKLYSGEEHAFVFPRTVSRLMEMQSPEYRRS